MKKKIWIAGVIWLTGAFLIGSGALNKMFVEGEDGFPQKVYAAKKSSKDIADEIEDANAKKKQMEQEREQLQKDIAAMEEKKENVVEYIEALDEKLSDLSDKIAQNTEAISVTKKQITNLRREKKTAEEKKQKQYDTMKQRIKYMYENGNEDYLSMLMESQSLADLFNRAEYVSKVSLYDRNMLKTYEDTCAKILFAEKEIEKELDELENLKKSLTSRKESVNLLAEKKSEELDEYKTLIAGKNVDIGNKNNLIAKQEEELENLMAAKRKQIEQEEATKKAAQKKENTSNNNINPSTEKENTSKDNAVAKPDTSAGYRWPLTVSGRITSYFGYRESPTAGASSYHKGIDISVPVGSSIVAVKDGTVVTSTYSSSAGKYICISHGGGVYSYYMHCSALNVSEGTVVKKGQKIALSGNTGISTGPHLHFGLFMNGSYVNPLSYLKR